jgi:hypothetical protein
MPATLAPKAVNNSTIAPPDSDDLDSPWYSWIPTPDVWNAAPTILLPPAKPAPPVPIPDGVYLIPTDMLPPPMVNVAQTTAPSIKPPPMIGPIQVVDVVATMPESDTAPILETPPAPAPREPPIAEFPLERCAAIAASLALRPADMTKTLEAQNLDSPTWIDLECFWSTAIKTALGEGDATLLRAYDAAFVASLEKLRGPITADDHARIVAARGRGRSVEALKTLGLPICADLPIERVMLQRAINLHS